MRHRHLSGPSGVLLFTLVLVAIALGATTAIGQAGRGDVASDAARVPGVRVQEPAGDPLIFSDAAYVVLMSRAGIGELSGPSGATIEASQDSSSQADLAVLSGVPADAPSTGRPGIFLTIPEDIEGTLAGRPIRVTVVARSSGGATGDRSFAVAYSTAGDGNSGWRQFDLTGALTAYSFDYDAPAIVNGGGMDLVGIHPDPGGGVGSIAVAAIAVEPIIIPPRTTAFYEVAVERVALPRVQSRRGALAKVGDLLLYSAQKGQLYLIAGLGASVREVDLAIPLQHTHPALARFRPAFVSIYDIAAEPSPSGQVGLFDLYASYLGIDDRERCLHLALSRSVVAVAGDELSVVAGWEEVFRSEPCLPLDSMEAINNETGGRIAFDAEGIVLTIGTANTGSVFARAEEGDYGKVIRLDRTTFEPHTISIGHRNPQGLFIDDDGTIFETEHGPEGGDEINIVEDGRDYGWPVVTYGTNYGSQTYCRPRPCDADSSQGRHLGFEQPIYAFVPSIGISQIIRVTSDEQFPVWQGDFLVASLAAEALYRVHVDEGQVVRVVEPIELQMGGLRDMIEMDDGRVAILTNERELLIVSNADRGTMATLPTPDPDPTSGIAEALLAELVVEARTRGDQRRGEVVFEDSCAGCHSELSEGIDIGPPLGCVFGRAIAARADFSYSASLRRFSSRIWSQRSLNDLLEDPAGWTAGTSMDNTSVESPADRSDLIAYLAAIRETNCRR